MSAWLVGVVLFGATVMQYSAGKDAVLRVHFGGCDLKACPFPPLPQQCIDCSSFSFVCASLWHVMGYTPCYVPTSTELNVLSP